MLQTLNTGVESSRWCVFQVPKGMLQTESPSGSVLFRIGVSSPQGNATNTQGYTFNWYEYNGFKSPRECYKQLTKSSFASFSCCFKSPRECYKLVSWWSCWPNCEKVFQVPKGMLQTVGDLTPYNSSPDSFKSPRECYKLNGKFESVTEKVGFKSPRECYKPIGGDWDEFSAQ